METPKCKCSWCGRTGEMKYAGIREFAGRYFCNERCLRNYEWFYRNGENWMTVKENENDENTKLVCSDY